MGVAHHLPMVMIMVRIDQCLRIENKIENKINDNFFFLMKREVAVLVFVRHIRSS